MKFMTILKNLEKLLKDAKVKYEIVKHRTVYTALDLAKTLRAKPTQVVKSVILKIGKKDYIMALVPSHKYLDKTKLLKEVNAWLKKQGQKAVKTIDFAQERWMKTNIKGKVGATPPFGSLFKIPTFVDKSLLKAKHLIIRAGDYKASLKIATNQLEKAEKFIKGSFSKSKK